MTTALVLRPPAFDDIDDAEQWYERKEPGLGERLLAEVERTFVLIQENPEAYPVVEHSIRRAVVRRFPYNVFYLSETDRVVVLAVFHQAMSPLRLADRH